MDSEADDERTGTENGQIASVRTVTKTCAEKRRAILIDLGIGLCIPLLQIPLHSTSSKAASARPTKLPPPSSSSTSPPILTGAVSSVYCILSIKSFHHSRAQFKELLSANKNLNLNRYVRLMALASTDLFLTTPWASGSCGNFSRVVQVPGIYWRADPYSAASVETLRWATLACALLFFAFFGFADEAIKNYREAFQSVAKRMGYSTAGSSRFSSTGCRNLETPHLLLLLAQGDAHALTLGDVSRMLPDYKESDYSSAPSSDTESVHSDAEEIEVSSLHRASVHITLSPPEPAHVRRSSVPDGPMPVVDAADIV
ncbi:pheromone A receptor-domain-containing protein [Mycena leptocephala]|nr:pheromone A receptor-domain-containing protein [Mycena leptocephala]